MFDHTESLSDRFASVNQDPQSQPCALPALVLLVANLLPISCITATSSTTASRTGGIFLRFTRRICHQKHQGKSE
ncbi:MAG: hypothetical protein B7C54_12510 [Acidimicrobiales bacterium mtb01]|nr:MAG: hypothetical protein B7C54_12510 [Acidimicrobiales bacterium mtb01]